MKQQAQNTFTEGLNTDFHPLTCKNTVLTDALNATIVTTKGNEMVLQNDSGNQIINENVKLKPGYIPIGIKEYSGILYIVSYNKFEDKGEIGTYPSPEYNSTDLTADSTTETTYDLVEAYKPLYNGCSSKNEPIELKELNTPYFYFDLNHPVSIEIQKSYDGSINLLLTDNKNAPRLINTRFAVLGEGTYKVPQRRKNYDNIYNTSDRDTFLSEISLIKSINKFPIVEYKGVLGSGNLKVGNYTFYFKYTDSDGNETDWVAESSIVSIFKGVDADPFTIDGGIEDMNSYKSVEFNLYNIDDAYNYIKVYYVRNSAAKNQGALSKTYEVLNYFKVENNKCNIIITGDEEISDASSIDINQSYQIVDTVKTQAQCQNILFQGNVTQSDTHFKELTNLSLKIIPSVIKTKSSDKIGYINQKDYKDTSTLSSEDIQHSPEYFHNFKCEYFNTKNIYYNVGYWNEEYYRLGIVYIYENGSTSSVYNILGGTFIPSTNSFSQKRSTTIDTIEEENNYITNYYLDNNNIILGTPTTINQKLNTKGVIHINDSEEVTGLRGQNGTTSYDTDTYIYNLRVTISEAVVDELKILKIKGFFIVRQKRIPTIVCQGFTLPWDKEAKIPLIETIGYNAILNVDNNSNFNNELNKLYQVYYTNNSFTGTNIFGAYKDAGGNREFFSKVYLAESFLRSYKVLLPPIVTNDYIYRICSIPAYAIDTRMIYKLSSTLYGSFTEGYLANYKTLYCSYGAFASDSLNSVYQNIDYGTITEFENMFKNRQFNDWNLFDLDIENSSVNSIFKHFYDLYQYCDGNQLTALCPEFELNQSYYNQLFASTEYTIKYTKYQQGILINDTTNPRIYYTTNTPLNYQFNLTRLPNQSSIDISFNSNYQTIYQYKPSDNLNKKFKICSVTDDVPVIAIDNTVFKSILGNSSEAYLYSYINEEGGTGLNYDKKADYNIARGLYGPYLGIVSNATDGELQYDYCRTFNIYYPNYNKNTFEIRFKDNSPYYCISERISWNILDTVENYHPLINSEYIIPEVFYSDKNIEYNLFRGDCFLCTFTHRLNRNFNDESAPTNDTIVDELTWYNNYMNETNLQNINRGDINAVKLGSWLTIKIKASKNLSIRSLDTSFTTEMGTIGRARGFYPIYNASADGIYKLNDSYVFNDGFSSTVGAKIYNTQPDASYIKNEFANRIMYSDLNVNDAQINGYRMFRSDNYKDYYKQYGSIIKLLELQSNLLCVFEHGVALIPVSERALAAQNQGGEIYITSSKILPDNIQILNDMYGTQWADSVVKTPYWVYGVDVSAKKIWATNGTTFKIISDFKISKFLHNNLNLGSNNFLPTVGIKNVVSHYNASKTEVMFTVYYDDVAFNICHNILLGGENGQFTTFYSWVPLLSANINNKFYSFNKQDITKTTNLYLWSHGKENNQEPYPCYWYNEQHPFEFEFVVNMQQQQQKIFDNLQLISNKAEPESFHYTIEGDNYEFSEDKPNMYVRQETTKETYQNLTSSLSYNDNYKKLLINGLEQLPKSNIFPLYYNRIDTPNKIYDTYTQMIDSSKNRDYCNLSGSEIIWDEQLNEFFITTHIKNLPLEGHWKLATELEYNNATKRKKEKREDNTFYYYVWENGGRIRGNSQYREDRWIVQIPSITFMQKNEKSWEKPPLVLTYIPDELKNSNNSVLLTADKLPNTYNLGQVSLDQWTYRKETKIRDKYMKIRIRYSGKDPVIITSILTTFTPSYI